MLQLAVTDTGIGFDSEAARRLFARFTQADGSISRQYGGTGLGLAICKALVDLMGGEIGAESMPGAGSTFTARIPLPRAMSLSDYDARPLGAQPAQETADLSAEVGRLRILLVEDHPTNQRVAQLILEPAGVDLTIVGNGREAIEVFRPNLFDVILMGHEQVAVLGDLGQLLLKRPEGLEVQPISRIGSHLERGLVDVARQAVSRHPTWFVPVVLALKIVKADVGLFETVELLEEVTHGLGAVGLPIEEIAGADHTLDLVLDGRVHHLLERKLFIGTAFLVRVREPEGVVLGHGALPKTTF